MTTTPPAPLLTAESLDRIEAQHALYLGDADGMCCECSDPWPCDTARLVPLARAGLAATANAALTEAARAYAAAELHRKRLWEMPDAEYPQEEPGAWNTVRDAVEDTRAELLRIAAALRDTAEEPT